MPDLELQLAQTPLPEPPAAVKPRLLAQARRERRWRSIERAWRWTLVTAAALVVVLNLHFGKVHEQRMLALVGPPPTERIADVKAFVRHLERHQRLLIAWSSGELPSQLKEEML